MLRSKNPEGVRQEVYGLACTHYAIRALVAEVADHHGVGPEGSALPVRCKRLAAASALGPARAPRASPRRYGQRWAEIGHELLPERRLRAAARVVKRKMSNGVRRPEHACWPRPTLRPAQAVKVVAAAPA